MFCTANLASSSALRIALALSLAFASAISPIASAATLSLASAIAAFASALAFSFASASSSFFICLFVCCFGIGFAASCLAAFASSSALIFAFASSLAFLFASVCIFINLCLSACNCLIFLVIVETSPPPVSAVVSVAFFSSCSISLAF